MDGELREFYKELGNSGNFVSLLFPQLEPFRIFKTPLYFAKPLFLVAFAAFPCPLHPALLTLSLCLKRFVFAFFFFLRGCVICCWSETLFLVFFFFVIDNVCPGAWYRFFLYFRNCLCACFPITVRYFEIKMALLQQPYFRILALLVLWNLRAVTGGRTGGEETESRRGVFFSILISSFRFCCWLIFLRFSFI